MDIDRFKALTLQHQNEVFIKKDTWLTSWFGLMPFIRKNILKQNIIISILVEKVFETTHQKGRRNQHPDLARLEFFIAYYVHIWLYSLINSGLCLTHAQDRVTFYLKSTDQAPNGVMFPNQLNLNNLEKIIQRKWRKYLPHFTSRKELNDFCRKLAVDCERPHLSESKLLQWEYGNIGIINLLIRTHQHASVRSAETRASLRECVRYPDSAFAKGENHRQAESAVLGSESEQNKYFQTFLEKIEASFYGTFNIGLWRDEDHAFKHMYEIAAHLGYAYHNIRPPELSKQAFEIIDLWCDEIAKHGADVLSAKDIYTFAIGWLLQKDVEIQSRSGSHNQLPGISLMERFNLAAHAHNIIS